ncbi:cytochrome c [Sediminibacterium sp.]|uniref:c-type cytochrome n=1 Tax=Sediminibacterium sp. TaxID=1917865 RepID=UPI0025D1F10D|nr:cytochrome c [Sediminibacterium sp.]MBT9484462.1 cytochrome c [Sediminibacterium sp.]
MKRGLILGGLLFSVYAAVAFIQPANLAKSIANGKTVYTNNCMNCHMEDGKGLAGAFPPIAKSDYLKRSPKDLISVILKGQSGEIKVNGVVYNGMMPAQDYLSDEEIADVLNYVNNSWGNKNLKPILPSQVKQLRP